MFNFITIIQPTIIPSIRRVFCEPNPIRVQQWQLVVSRYKGSNETCGASRRVRHSNENGQTT